VEVYLSIDVGSVTNLVKSEIACQAVAALHHIPEAELS
jgi:hypothetical protein